MNINHPCPICSRVNCTYSYAACKYQNRCIRKWPKKTIREKIFNEYTQYLHSLEKTYKINRGENTCINLYGEFNVWNQDTLPTYYNKHSVHVTNKCNTRILKDVLHWRDLFEKLLKQYNKDKGMLRGGLKLLDIETLTHEHYGNGNKNKKMKGNEYVVSLCK